MVCGKYQSDYTEYLKLGHSGQAGGCRWVRTYLAAEHVCQLCEAGMYKTYVS